MAKIHRSKNNIQIFHLILFIYTTDIKGIKFILEFTTSKKGVRKLLGDGYIYLFKKKLENKFSCCECELQRGERCCASVKLDVNNTFLEERIKRNYPPSNERKEVVKVKVNIKRHATKALDPAKKIIATEAGVMLEEATVNTQKNI